MSEILLTPKEKVLELVRSFDPNFVTIDDEKDCPETLDEMWDWLWSKRISSCGACLLSKTRTTVVKPDGKPGNNRIMIVGEGPGQAEDLCQVPLVGPLELRGSRCGSCKNVDDCYDNRMLKNYGDRMGRRKKVTCNPNFSNELQLKNKFYLQSAGTIVDGILVKKWKMAYPRHNWVMTYNKLHSDKPWTHESPFVVTNITHCRSFDSQTGFDTAPSLVARRACKRWLVWEWAIIQPSIVIVLGKVALDVIAGDKEGARHMVNEIFDTKFGKVIFNFHPARMMREKNSVVKSLSYAKLGLTFSKALEFAGYVVN